MKLRYLAVGFSDKAKRADFYREYARKGNARRMLRKMSGSGKYQLAVLREEKIYVDTADALISTSTPIETINMQAV